MAKGRTGNLPVPRSYQSHGREDTVGTECAGGKGAGERAAPPGQWPAGMAWLPLPVLPKKQWPKVEYGTKRAITWEEPQRIIQREPNPARRGFYELSWLVGGSPGDLAQLNAEDINWDQHGISYRRPKSQPMALT